MSKSNKTTTFTGQRLDWLKCVSFDRSIQPYDFEVAFQIAQHLNEKTATAFVSDETIADKTGGGSSRNVWNSRIRLRDAGWLTWRRTRTANVYSLNYGKVNGVLDMITVSSDARREKQQKPAKAKKRDMKHSSYLTPPDTNHSAEQDTKPSSDIHPRGTPYREEGSRRRL